MTGETKVKFTFTEIRDVIVTAEIEIEDIKYWDELTKDEKYEFLEDVISNGKFKQTAIEYEDYHNLKIMNWKEVD